MPSAPIVTWARIFPLLAAVTPRSRYLKKERRPATRGAVVGVAYASLPGGFTAAGSPIGVLASSIMETSSNTVPPILPDPRADGSPSVELRLQQHWAPVAAHLVVDL